MHFLQVRIDGKSVLLFGCQVAVDSDQDDESSDEVLKGERFAEQQKRKEDRKRFPQ